MQSQIEKVNFVLLRASNFILIYLSLIDIMNFSMISKSFGDVNLSPFAVSAILKQANSKLSIATSKELLISFSVTLKMLRNICFKISQSRSVSLIIASNHRIMLDYGISYIPLPPVSQESTEIFADTEIQKYLEVLSNDEFDDFTPRLSCFKLSGIIFILGIDIHCRKRKDTAEEIAISILILKFMLIKLFLMQISKILQP